MTDRDLLRIDFAFDCDEAALARALDFHGIAPFK
jgi:hypothetical protein